MNLTELRERIARWEDLHTEFKQWPVQPDDLAAAIVAFANTDGGQLILGVSRDREIVGVADVDAAARVIDNVTINNCEPAVTVAQETVVAEGRTVLVVNVPKGDMRPYRTNRGVYYIRTTSGRRTASQEELLRLFQSTEALYYDETPMLRLSVADLDLDALERFVNTFTSDLLDVDRMLLLRNWKLIADAYPTIAGLLLFGREPQLHLPWSDITAARFPGRDITADPLDRKDLGGRLLDIVAAAESFLNLHLLTPHVTKGFEPERKPELPKEALREAIVNAVAHRDYTIRGPIRLFIFDDRVEIHTPGKPPNGVDVAAMRAGTHVPRNPHIYARLLDAGLVTRAGRGIRRLITLVREATGSEVGIEITNFETLLILPRRNPNA